MEKSNGNVLGVKAIGDIRKSDYNQLTPMCERIINEFGDMRMLLDMQDFRFEEPSAWRSDLHFGREFHNRIERVAIVGDKRWEAWLTDFCAPFYAREAKFFHSDDRDLAWDWLTEGMEWAA